MQYSIVGYREINNNRDFRIDAEYYKPEILELIQNLSKKKTIKFNNLIEIITDGKHGGVTFTEHGVLFIRNTNVKEGFLDLGEKLFISEKESAETKRAEITTGDILLTSIGTIGLSLVVPPEIKRANINQNLVKIMVKKEYSPYYISIFLNSKYGRAQSIRLGGGNVQGIINYPKIKSIDIYYPKKHIHFIDTIEKIYKTAIGYEEQSKSIYQKAEQSLFAEFQIPDCKIKNRLFYIKSFSETQKIERIDAEYFQPKYDEIMRLIKNYKGGFKSLRELVKIEKNIEVGSRAYQDFGVPFIRVSNISNFEILNSNLQNISEELYIKLINYQPKKNEILLSKDASPGIAHHIKNEPIKMIPSGGILRLEVYNNLVNEEYFTLVLNSMFVQQQMERDIGGSVINHWRVDQIKNVIVPILSKDKQKQIKKQIKKSVKKREETIKLLEIAKIGVELAIEQDEQIAEEWINQELNKLGIT